MFIRPTAIGTVLQQPSRESKQTARPGSNAPTGRQSQAGGTAGVRKSVALPPTAVKRQSTNAIGTPTPAPKIGSRPSLRVCPYSFVLRYYVVPTARLTQFCYII
jgi:dynactin 1